MDKARQLFNPKDFLQRTWEIEAEMESLEKDYSQNSFYSIRGFKETKTVHLISHFSVDQELANFKDLSEAITTSFAAGAETVVLHLITDLKIHDTWKEFHKEFWTMLEVHKDKIFLGSLGHESFLMNPENDMAKICVGLRVIIDQTDSVEKSDFLTIDEYFKVKYGARYYENYHEYSEADQAYYQQPENIPTQISKILENNPEGLIFPIDLKRYSIKLNDELWFINKNGQNIQTALQVLLELNHMFKLNLTILTPADYGIVGAKFLENGLSGLEIDSRQVYYPITK
ncbi:MAG: hypothetical protein WCK98_07240 [bacterium]